jgi:two-component system LytT family response regulator
MKPGMERQLRVLVVDDEPVARKVLREELELFPDVTVVGEAENGRQALDQIALVQPNLVFLDLQMPVMGGFEVIANLRGGPIPAIIIVTAFDQHAIQAFEAGAIDYLLKPVGEARLEKAIDRARAMQGKDLQIAENVLRLSDTVGASQPAGAARKIVGKLGEEYFLLDQNEVLAFHAEGEIVTIITAKHRYIATQSLRAIEERLRNSPFQRVHRNSIVNVNHVRKMSAMSSQRWLLTLSNSQEFVVSKRLAHSVRHMLNW